MFFFVWKLWEISVFCDHNKTLTNNWLNFSTERLVIELSKQCRNGWSISCFLVFIWVVDWRVENKTFLFVHFFSEKNSIKIALWKKKWRNCWVQLWKINVMGTFFWSFLSILKNLLLVHKSSKSYSNMLPQTERCHVCRDWSSDAKCKR